MSKWFTHEMIVAPGDAQHPRNTEADIIELKDGMLLLGWSEFYSGAGQDWSPSRISKKISKDGGVTWSDAGILLENEGEQCTMEVDFLRMPSGDICLFYCRKNSNDDCRVMMRKSKDEGESWSEPKQLSDWHGYVGLTNDRSILTSTGRIILPFWYSIQDAFLDPWYSVAQVLYSDDEGESWQLSMPPMATPYSTEGVSEPTVVELSDGRILMFLRNHTGRIWQSISEDGGARWGRPTPTELGTSVAPILLKRIPNSNDIIVIWNQASKQELELGLHRSRISCAISSDDGKTWKHFKNLESHDDIAQVEPSPIGRGPEVQTWIWDTPFKPNAPWSCSYPSCLFVGDRAIITYYYPTDVCSLKLRVLDIGWFYDDSAPSIVGGKFGAGTDSPGPV